MYDMMHIHNLCKHLCNICKFPYVGRCFHFTLQSAVLHYPLPSAASLQKKKFKKMHITYVESILILCELINSAPTEVVPLHSSHLIEASVCKAITVAA